MASDLISRDAVIKSLWDEKAYNDSFAYRLALMKILDVPAVDAVEVVRCKHCKHCFPARIPLCDAEGFLHPIAYNIETWFCPLGERKEDAVD